MNQLREKLLRPVDDIFMQAILSQCSEAERRELAQWMLEAILPEETVQIMSGESQMDMKQASGVHSVRFDLFAWDVNGSLYDVEFQNGPIERARLIFYSSVMALYGQEYKRLRNSCTIFITEPKCVKNIIQGPFEKTRLLALHEFDLSDEPVDALIQRVFCCYRYFTILPILMFL